MSVPPAPLFAISSTVCSCSETQIKQLLWLYPTSMIVKSRWHSVHQIKILLHVLRLLLFGKTWSKNCYLPPTGSRLLDDHATTRSGREVEIRLIRLDWNFPTINGAVLCVGARPCLTHETKKSSIWLIGMERGRNKRERYTLKQTTNCKWPLRLDSQ